MKNIITLLVTVLSLQLSAQQHTSILFLRHPEGQTASAIDYSFTTGVPGDLEARCNQFKRMRKAGKILIFSGVGMAGASIVLATAGVVYSIRHVSDYSFYDPTDGIYIASGVIGGVGMLGILSGIPTLAVGRAKGWKYCGGNPHLYKHHQSYISTNGTNLALNF